MEYLIPGISDRELRAAASQDGLLITGPVNSYHPNGYGAYCMSGNVAEMIVDSNITKGGSWEASTLTISKLHLLRHMKELRLILDFVFLQLLKMTRKPDNDW